jgi:hypothetical protein
LPFTTIMPPSFDSVTSAGMVIALLPTRDIVQPP